LEASPRTAFLYYGNELGLKDLAMRPDQVHDPYFPTGKGRDPYRSPMPWTGERGSGFTTGEPWLPLAQNYTMVNVEAQKADPRSMLRLCQRLISLRRTRPALAGRNFRPRRGNDSIVAFERPHDTAPLLVMANIGAHTASFAWDGDGEIILSSHLDREGQISGPIKLRPDEALVVAGVAID
jgi:alpha-glucosidase